MSDRGRIAITVASTLALGATIVAYQLSLGDRGSIESHILGFGVLGAYGAALVGVFIVDRWWALLSGVSAGGFTLLAAALYQPPDPWSSEAVPLTPVMWVGILILVVGFDTAFLSLGLLARAIWDRLLRPRLSTAITNWSTR